MRSYNCNRDIRVKGGKNGGKERKITRDKRSRVEEEQESCLLTHDTGCRSLPVKGALYPSPTLLELRVAGLGSQRWILGKF